MANLSELPKALTPGQVEQYRKRGQVFDRGGFPAVGYSEHDPTKSTGGWVDLRQPLPQPPQPKND